MQPFKVFKADVHLTDVSQNPVMFPSTMCHVVFYSL